MLKLLPLNLLCAGECMLELYKQGKQFTYGFAGDVINFSIYLKRIKQDATIYLLSAIGDDELSTDMLKFIEQEKIDSTLVFKSSDKTIGLYMIRSDKNGDRKFNYWRSDSAAKQMISLADKNKLENISTTINYFYFSGITLAILTKKDREKFLEFVQYLHTQGKIIIFDPNFRSNLWNNQEEARTLTQQSFRLAHIVLASFDDQQTLFNLQSSQAMIEQLLQFNVDEAIITNGEKNITGLSQGDIFEVAVKKIKNIVDTTAAGDAFNAGYIAARHSGKIPSEAAITASSLAAKVVMHRGAIIPL